MNGLFSIACVMFLAKQLMTAGTDSPKHSHVSQPTNYKSLDCRGWTLNYWSQLVHWAALDICVETVQSKYLCMGGTAMGHTGYIYPHFFGRTPWGYKDI